MLIQTILLVIAGYLVGSIPAAYIIARWRRGIDMRKHGSGNVGAANTLTVVGKRWSIFVTIFDIGKGALMVWLAGLTGLGTAAQAAVGIATIIGHDWPVFLRFQGGRGVFTTLGVITILSPWQGLMAFIYPYLFWAPFKQVSVGVSTVMVILPFISAFAHEPLGIKEPATITASMVIMMLIMSVRRLTTARSAISQDIPLYELIFYRLVFDRDIKDRKAWISQKRDS
jgi:glycerol-3-phosphate acyltransferase PlsY